MRSLEGQTALVIGGGSHLGRAVALALSARGVRIVVTGRDEKALGETVGEIVHGGGKARHVTGNVDDAAHVVAAAARAREIFGSLDIAVVTDATDAARIFNDRAFGAGGAGPSRLIAAVAGPSAATSALVRDVALTLAIAGEKATCNAIVVVDRTAEEDAADDVAALAVFLCARTGTRITGQTVVIGPIPADASGALPSKSE
jgi:hypothetical protein